jgi:ferric-dicitrate binding protein FerR (iron transport regulator)
MARDDQTERDMTTLSPDRESDADAGRLNDAAVWHARLRQDVSTEETWIEFAAWLESDNDNRVAFDLVEDLYFALDEAEPHLTPAVGDEPKSAVVSLVAWRAMHRFPVRTGAVGLGLLAASLLVVIGIRSSDVAGHVDR